jgi:HAD superfamily hydrolase (TIGR01450 family)
MAAFPLNTLRSFLLDMDGTVYLGPHPIPGASEFIRFLRETGRRFLFFTNNPSSDATHYAAKLGTMGIEAEPSDILTAGEATALYLAGETPYRRLFVLGTPSFEEELRRTGLECGAKDPEAVVLAFDKTLTYEKLERACLLLAAGLPYIATNPDRVCPTEYGYIPDCGAIAALIEAATRGNQAQGRLPKYVGKPNPEMARMGLAKIGAAPETSAMVGDRLYTDMEMAHRAGIGAILVLSGETLEADLDGAPRPPDYVFGSVRELQRAMEE